jgi:hypothetical protein
MHNGDFELFPTFKMPDFRNVFARRAYDKILGKRGRQTYTFWNAEDSFNLYIEDKFIRDITLTHIDLAKK